MVDIFCGYLEVASRRFFPSKIYDILILVLPGSLACQITFVDPGVSDILVNMGSLVIFNHGLDHLDLIHSVGFLKLETLVCIGQGFLQELDLMVLEYLHDVLIIKLAI